MALPSATILNYLNTATGQQHIKFKKTFKQIFVQVAKALTALGNANGATILGLVNQISNEEQSWSSDFKTIFLDTAAGLTALGQTATSTAITNYFKQNPSQNLVWGDQVKGLIVQIQASLAALGQ